jgi:2-methylcitrate dehydratase
MSAPISNVRPKLTVLSDIADYVTKFKITSKEAFATAHHCLIDTLGCGLEALSYPAPSSWADRAVRSCRYGAPPPSSSTRCGSVQHRRDIADPTNDTWLAADRDTRPSRRHPPAGSRTAVAEQAAAHDEDVLIAMIKAHEIQGVIALENSFNRVGLDHVVLSRSPTAVVANMGLAR